MLEIIKDLLNQVGVSESSLRQSFQGPLRLTETDVSLHSVMNVGHQSDSDKNASFVDPALVDQLLRELSSARSSSIKTTKPE